VLTITHFPSLQRPFAFLLCWQQSWLHDLPIFQKTTDQAWMCDWMWPENVGEALELKSRKPPKNYRLTAWFSAHAASGRQWSF
jgi:hypothetical protein